MIYQIWGDKLGKEILEVIEKWKINFKNFLNHQKSKGQNLMIGVSKLLYLADSGDQLVQCTCGEVMGFNDKILEAMKKVYLNGIKCDKCDRSILSV